MRLTWERVRQGMARGRSADGEVRAQVAHVLGPGGQDLGWQVWLMAEQGELFDRYPTGEAAQAAAEAALDTSSDPEG